MIVIVRLFQKCTCFDNFSEFQANFEFFTHFEDFRAVFGEKFCFANSCQATAEAIIGFSWFLQFDDFVKKNNWIVVLPFFKDLFTLFLVHAKSI